MQKPGKRLKEKSPAWPTRDLSPHRPGCGKSQKKTQFLIEEPTNLQRLVAHRIESVVGGEEETENGKTIQNCVGSS